MYVKIVKSGDLIETYVYEKTPITSRPRRKEKVSSPGRFRRVVRRRGDNIARTRKNFRRLVQSNLTGVELPALLTLTMVDVVRVDHAYICLKGFFSVLKRDFGRGLRYIAVPEFQKRSAVHFHILIWGLPKEIIENERVYRTLQHIWALGFVDCVQTDGSIKLAGYLAKYMSKSVQDERLAGRQAYTCSRNVMRSVLGSTFKGFEGVGDVIFKSQENLTSRKFMTQWLGECSYTLSRITGNEP